MPRRPGMLLAILVPGLVLMLGACSTATTTGPTVSDAWARPAMAAGQPAAAYLVIHGGGTADALLKASSPQAESVELHETTTDASGMTGMKPMDRLDVPAGGTVSLAPGGMHLMIMGLAKPLEAGQKLEIDLVFEHAGTVVVQAEVRSS